MQPINPIVRRWRQDATENPDQFWARAAEQLPWLRKWDSVFEWEYPTFRWFVGQVMKLSRGQVDPRRTEELLRQALADPDA